MVGKLFTLFVAGAALCLSTNLFADHDYDLHLNGDFRGTPAGNSIVPGWSSDSNAGIKIVPGNDFNEFVLNVKAPADTRKTVFSDMYAIPAGALELKAKISGTGNAAIGFEAFDAAKAPIPQGAKAENCPLSQFSRKFKFYFQLPANTRYIRIVLNTEQGSEAFFHDVEAEIKQMPVYR